MNVTALLIPLIAVLLAGMDLVAARAARADADLMVYPTRVVLSDRQRTAQVDIVNTSQTKVTYKIALARKRMTDSGTFEDASVPEPAEKFADDLVKYSPRQVTLMPGAGQTIRMMYKLPSGLSEGEYRSHLVFTKMAAGISVPSDKDDVAPGAVSMQVTVNVGISIPVIVRHGKLEAKATIDPSSVNLLTVEPKQQVVVFTVSRAGTRSIYGDVVVYRGEEKVAVGNGFAVYAPNTTRKIAVHVADPYQLKSGEKIRVVFTERDEKEPLAETATTIP